MKTLSNEYFKQARSWSDDIYVEVVASRNRYRLALMCLGVFVGLLMVAFLILLPLQRTQLVMVHHHDDGVIWTELVNQKTTLPINQAQIDSDIVRYVINHESYSPATYDYQYSLIHILSNKEVAKEYQQSQSLSNPIAPINRFRNRITRKVEIENIVSIKKDKQHPLAQVNYRVIDRDHLTGTQKKTSMLALISWKYRGLPKDPGSQWQNWDGFTVTHYSTQQRHI